MMLCKIMREPNFLKYKVPIGSRLEYKRSTIWADLKLILVLSVCPDLVGREGERHKVEEGGYPAVEGRLLVAHLDVCLPLLPTPVLTRSEYLSVLSIPAPHNQHCIYYQRTYFSSKGMSSTNAGLPR